VRVAPDRSTVDPGRRDRVLAKGWQRSADLAWTTSGDMAGFHLLVAEERTGYSWRTVASLREPGIETDRWIGNVCFTESGRKAVVVYAPRAFTNKSQLFQRGGFTAVVDVATGAVTKVPLRSTLAYFNPGCGAGERAIITQARGGDGPAGDGASTRLVAVDATTATVGSLTEFDGQVTSAIPAAGGAVAAEGRHLIAVDRAGRKRVLASAASSPFRLAQDAVGGVVFMEHAQGVGYLRRLSGLGAGGSVVELARGQFGKLDVVAAPHRRLFVTGAAQVTGSLPASARRLDVPADAEVSTGGQLAILPQARPSPGVGRDGAANPPAAWTAAMTLPSTGGTDRPRQLTLTTKVVATGERVDFALTPGVRAAPVLAEGAEAHPLNAAPPAGGASVAGSPTSPLDSEAYCSIPRNDPRTQVYQPTPRQVEWAADQAVVNNLRMTRPANWKQSGISSSWTPQGLFPPIALAGGGRVPVQVLLGVLSQESNLWQASGHALSGEPGNPLIGNYYGVDVYDEDTSNDWDIDWSESDCGYGVSQITDGMRKPGLEKPGTPPALPANSQRAVAVDYATNIAAGLRILQSKWNETRAAGLIHANGDPAWLENWYFAIWAYNSGFHPNPGNGSPWGVGWANNPANPQYPPGRSFFNLDPHDAAHPQDWPYPEKVIGFAAFAISTLDGPGFRPAWWNSDLDRLRAKPPIYHFCTPQNNDCYSGSSFLPNCPEPSCDDTTIGEPAGPCAHKNGDGYYDLKCWWHSPTTFNNCASGLCGHELLRFDTTYPEQPDGTNYPPNCSTTGLPSGALVVDDVAASVPSLRSCTRIWTTAGSFSLRFAADSTGHYPSKIDFHQLGSGFGGHFWFAHSRWSGLGTADKLQVTGTWTPPSTLSGWTRIKVHLPNHGAHTQLADSPSTLATGRPATAC
jgi:hypothetical protein